MIAFSVGIWLSTLIPALPPFNAKYLLLPATVLLLLSRFLPLFAAYCLGLAWGILHLQTASEELLPKALENSQLWITGEISGLINETGESQRLVFTADQYCTQPDIVSCQHRWKEWEAKVRLNDYYLLPVVSGGTYILQVKLKRPHGFANPWTFDYEAWLWEQGIRATGSTLDTPPVTTHKKPGFPIPASSLQSLLNDKINVIAGNPAIRGGYTQLPVIRALTVGNRYNISDQQWTLFEQTGTTHLMVISGVHVGLVAWLFSRLAGWCWSRSVLLMSRMPAPRLAALAGIAGAFSYCAVAGYSLPSVRAAIMVSLLFYCQFSLHQTRAVTVLCLALGIILFLNPMAPVTSGFWLSFGAVALLLFFMNKRYIKERDDIILAEPGRRHLAHRLYQQWLLPGVKAQCLLFIGMLPLLALVIGRVSLLAPLVNLFAVPLIGLVVVPLCLGSLLLSFVFPALAAFMLLLADFLLEGYQRLLLFVTDILPTATLSLPAIPFWATAVVLTASLLMLYARKTRWRLIALTGFMPLFYPGSQLPEQEAQFHVLDVGQGLAVLIETRNHLVIYDTGPAYSERFNAGSGLLVPYIMRGSLPKPDRLIISHGDNDHAGGLHSLLQVFPHAQVFSGEPERLAGTTAVQCTNQQWVLDGVLFRFLEVSGPRNSANNRSCILVVSTGKHQILLPGDIDTEMEAALLSTYQNEIQSDLLLAPHHGSISSSSIGMVNFTNPDWVIFSNGYLNSYNHPHPRVVARYRNRDISTLQTATEGAIQFRLTPEGISPPVGWRQSHPRVWR